MSLSEEQIQLIETTFKALGGKGKAFIEGFYEHVFEKSPEIEAMFEHTDWHQQRSKVMLTLIMVVDNLHNLEHIKVMLEKTTQTHQQYPIKNEHYHLMAEAILETFADILGDDLSSEAESAWRIALIEIARILQREPI